MGQPAPWVAVPGCPGVRRGLSLCSVIKSEWCKRHIDPWCFGEGDELCLPTGPLGAKHEPERTSSSGALSLAKPSASL